jgi:cytidylate kinase
MDVRRRTSITPPIAPHAEGAPAVEPIAPTPVVAQGDGRLFPSLTHGSTVTSTTSTTATTSTGIERIFEKKIGAAQMAALKSSLSSKPVVLIAGDQLTGKSTAAKSVALVLQGEASGTGRLMRAAAEQAGKPIEEFVKTVSADFDVELDWQATKKIAKGDVAVFESRLAGHLGQMLERMGRKNVVSVYLVASPRERALRYLQRELSPEVRARVEAKLRLPSDATLEQAMQAIVALDDPDANKIASMWKDIAKRDDVDKARLLDLYGVDYQDRSAFDVVVSTDGKQPADVQAEILAAVRARTVA